VRMGGREGASGVEFMLDVAGCRYRYSDQALSRAEDVYRRLTSPLKSTMISALPCPENTR
jgi:hypothetical protein